eukprot:c17947_g1_i1 orf=116-949(+)
MEASPSLSFESAFTVPYMPAASRCFSPVSIPGACFHSASKTLGGIHNAPPHAMAGLDSSGAVFCSNGSAASSALSSPAAVASAVDFLTLCERLKTTKRAGWVNHGLKDSESIADHMYRMAVMAIISADVPGINRDRCVKMAIVHDIAEAIVGDITPSDGIPKHEKSRQERIAIEEMCNLLGEGFAGKEVKELWLEYENNSSPEAQLVKDFDKIEMILQALEYETAQNKVLDDFFESTTGKIQTDIGKAWAAEVVTRRRKRLESLHQDACPPKQPTAE